MLTRVTVRCTCTYIVYVRCKIGNKRSEERWEGKQEKKRYTSKRVREKKVGSFEGEQTVGRKGKGESKRR